MNIIILLTAFLALTCCNVSSAEDGQQNGTKRLFVISSLPKKVMGSRLFKMGVRLYCLSPKVCTVVHPKTKTRVNRYFICGYCDIGVPISFQGDAVLVPVTFWTHDHVTASVDNYNAAGKQHVLNGFTLYPVLDKDTFFVMAVPEQTKFALVVARDGLTQVKVSYPWKYPAYDSMHLRQATLTVSKQKATIVHFNDILVAKGTVLRGTRPIAVFYGASSLIAQLPSIQHYGNDFILYQPDTSKSAGSNQTVVTATVFAPIGRQVIWSSMLDDGKWDAQRFQWVQICKSPYTLKFPKPWTTLRIKSQEFIVVLLTYWKKHSLGDTLAATFPIPVHEYKSDYLIRLPFGQREVKSHFAFVARRQEIFQIMLDKGNIGSFLKKGRQLAVVDSDAFKEEQMSMWVDVPIESRKLMHFRAVRADGSISGTVRFAVMLYSTEKGVYVTQVEGYSNYASLVQHSYQIGAMTMIDLCYPEIFIVERLMDAEKEKDQKTAIVLSVLVPLTAMLVGATFYAVWKTRQDRYK